MATVYRIICKAANQEVELDITDSLNPLPGSDTWKCSDAAWGIDTGSVASWGTTSAHLQGVGATPVAILEGFTKTTKKNDGGIGEKLYPDGSFPSGEFTWLCINKK